MRKISLRAPFCLAESLPSLSQLAVAGNLRVAVALNEKDAAPLTYRRMTVAASAGNQPGGSGYVEIRTSASAEKISCSQLTLNQQKKVVTPTTSQMFHLGASKPVGDFNELSLDLCYSIAT